MFKIRESKVWLTLKLIQGLELDQIITQIDFIIIAYISCKEWVYVYDDQRRRLVLFKTVLEQLFGNVDDSKANSCLFSNKLHFVLLRHILFNSLTGKGLGWDNLQLFTIHVLARQKQNLVSRKVFDKFENCPGNSLWPK